MEATKALISVIILSLFMSLSAFCQSGKEIDLKALDAYYTKMVKDWDLPAASIGIVKDGE